MNHKIRWIPYVQDSYKKILCAVRTIDGEIHLNKWPNAGKFMGGDYDIPQEKVTHIVEIGWPV